MDAGCCAPRTRRRGRRDARHGEKPGGWPSGSSRSFPTNGCRRCCARSAKRYPDVEISLTELTPTRQIEELVDRRIDLGIIGLGLPQPHDELEVAVMSEEGLVVALPLDHPMAKRRRMALRRSLAREKFIFTARVRCPGVQPVAAGALPAGGVRAADRVGDGPLALGVELRRGGVRGGAFSGADRAAGDAVVRFVPLDKSTPRVPALRRLA